MIGSTSENRITLRCSLAQSGFVLNEAVDANAGIQHVEFQTPDCILLDHNLPDLDCLQVIERLRRPDGQLPCALLVVTGSRDTTITAAAIKAGALDVVVRDHLDPDNLQHSIRRASREFRQSEEHRVAQAHNAHLASIIAASADGIISTERDGTRVRSWSSGATHIFGYTETEAVGRTTDELIVPEHLRGERARLFTVVETGRHAILVETLRRHKSGRLIPVEVNVSPIVASDGNVSGYSVIFRDITERKRSEEALRASEERLRATFENAAIGVAHVAPDGGWLQVNARLCEIVGYPREELLELSFQDITVPEDLDYDLGHVDRMLAGEIDAYEIEKRYRRRDGEIVWVDLWVGCVRDDERQIKFFISALQDITARKTAEAALRESEQRFRTYVTTAQEGIWAMDRTRRTTFANDRMAKLLGTDPQSMTNRPLADFCFEEDLGEVEEYFDAGLAGKAREFEVRFRRTDGIPVHLLCATAPIDGPDETVTGVLGGFLNLAQRIRADARQQTMMRELAHRGKNLLAIIQSIANRSMTNDRPMAEARDVFAGRLRALANSYGKLTDEAFEGAPLDEIMATELQAFTGRAQTDGPRIVLNVKAAQTMAIVVHELATNATKYGALSVPSGQLTVGWRVENGDAGRRFVFEWQETGGPPAISPTRRGFGSTLISSVAGTELNCTPELEYREAGFRYRINAPLGAVGAAVEESPVRQRLQSEDMRAFYDAWTGLRAVDGALPEYKRFNPARFQTTGGLTIAELKGDDDVQFIEIGKGLTERLGRVVVPADLASEDAHGMKASYLRCAQSNAPCYERTRFSFGDNDAVTFERLMLPFSRGGERVSHIVSLAIFTGATLPPDGTAHA